MVKILCSLRYLCLLGTLLSLSCATFLKPVNGSSKLDDKDSIIFGRVELLKNDQLIDQPGQTSFNSEPLILSHVSRHAPDALNRNAILPGQYAFRTHPYEDGYFAYAIPPGKYHFVLFSYFWLFEAKPGLDVCPHSEMTFDVPTNQAVYIGTIRHNFHTKWDNWLFVKGTLSVECTNEFEDAKKWFLKSNPQFETNIVESPVSADPVSN